MRSVPYWIENWPHKWGKLKFVKDFQFINQWLILLFLRLKILNQVSSAHQIASLSDSSGYSSSVKLSLNSEAKNIHSETESTDSFSSSSSNDSSKLNGATLTKSKSFVNADFIDSNPDKFRTSRTKLHKIQDSFPNYPSNNQQIVEPQAPIHFSNSPSHSPTRFCITTHKQYKRIQSQNINPLKQDFGSETKFASRPSLPTSSSTKCISGSSGSNQSLASSSSLLLMIQPNQTENKKLAERKSSKIDNQKFVSKATKSLSNLAESTNYPIPIETSYNTISYRRTPSNTNSNRIKAIHSANALFAKYYDKFKYNVIGEQETLV